MSAKKKDSAKQAKKKRKQLRNVATPENGVQTRDKGGLFGFMKGRMEIVGDIESPPVPLSEWNALGEDEDNDENE